MEGLKEFLEISTVHGLVHISTGRNKGQRIFWVSAVSTGFVIAGILISTSFGDWSNNPVSTFIEKFPIKEVSFPR